MAGRATPTADIMKGMRKWATQTTNSAAERETCWGIEFLSGKKVAGRDYRRFILTRFSPSVYPEIGIGPSRSKKTRPGPLA
ncbi:hypothetical protein DESUT3_00580 [Desulfuromonas versatilis]|uniref:Uncharacterized protein n=1 Tax=Desulfuromonas versatilis TaxID=2802975 RepID=A0ABM8HNF8_9BACT|nr:hypothetical protein DESUT3_00580 [Desulfuromonas versatilis]